MWLVLGEQQDSAAWWAAEHLSRYGLVPLVTLTPSELVHAERSVHRLSAGDASLELTLADGRTIRSEEIRGVLNRMQLLPCSHLAGARPDDVAYAQEEWNALVLSWLASFPSIVNRPSPQGLAGRWRSHAQWVALAGRAGLAAPTFTQSSFARPVAPRPRAGDEPVIVVDGAAYGPGARHPKAAQGCLRLAQLAGLRTMGCWLRPDPDDGCSFVAATLLPDLRAGGQALVRALATALSSGDGVPS
jgi:hypothetical protein